MPPAGFEPAVLSRERPQTHALYRAFMIYILLYFNLVCDNSLFSVYNSRFYYVGFSTRTTYFVSVALLDTQTVCLIKGVVLRLILASLIRAINTQRDLMFFRPCIMNLLYIDYQLDIFCWWVSFVGGCLLLVGVFCWWVS